MSEVADAMKDDRPLKISLCMIVRDEESHLAATLDTIQPYVDEVVVCDTGSKDKTVVIAEARGCKVIRREWKDDFSDARNASFDAATGDVLLWLDADDFFRNGEKLRELVKLNFCYKHVGFIMLPYRYEFDPHGNCVSEHWRERLIRKDAAEWKGRLHETAVLKRDFAVLRSSEVWVDHDTTKERIEKSKVRNLHVLTREIEETKPNVDPRTMWSYARALVGLGYTEASVGWLEQFVQVSGWREEKYAAYCLLARVYSDLGKHNHGVDASLRAMKLREDLPDAYLTLGRVYCNLEQWGKAVHWTNLGLSMVTDRKLEESLQDVNPRDYDLNPAIVLERAHFEMGNFEECNQALQVALKFLPKHPALMARQAFLLEATKDRKIAAAVDTVKGALIEEKDKEKLESLARAIPKRVVDYPFLNMPDVGPRGGRPTIAFYCMGDGSTKPWGPRSVAGGIGGSEEAVIELSKRLVKLGWDVTVMADTLENGVVDGVRWVPYFKFNPEQRFDVVVIWRSIFLADMRFNCGQLYLWLHDLQPLKEFWTPERIEKLTGVIVLSEFHRKEIPMVPDSKVWVSRNGIVPEHFTEQKVDREPFRCVYSSSQNRGLEYLLKVWPELKRIRPEAELHLYYGWETFDAFHRENPERMAWKERILEMCNQPGVVDHGRVGHKEIARAFLGAGYWLYPCFTFDEISCITAMKAQMARCLPIVATRGALAETVKVGIKCDTPDAWLDAAKRAFVEGAQLAPDVNVPDFSWDGVAKEWAQRFAEGVFKAAVKAGPVEVTK